MDWLPLPSSDVEFAFRNSRYVVLHEVLPIKVLRAWRTRAVALATRFALTISRGAGGDRLQYRVVTGDIIQKHWPELFQFYTGKQTREWIQGVTGEPQIFNSVNLRSALNINFLEQPGDAYRWHFDAVAYTLILFLADLQTDDG